MRTNNSSMHLFARFGKNALSILFLGAFALYALSVLSAPRQTAYAAGTITGTVFRDYDGDGVQDTREPGMGSITITAYDSAGASASTTGYQYVCAGSNSPAGLGCTGAGAPALGSYSLSTNSLAAGPYRLEFTWTQSYLQNAAFSSSANGNKTSVRFVPDGSSSNVNFAVSDPSQYSNTTNPRLLTNSYVVGSSTGSTQTAMYSWDYTFNTTPGGGGTYQGTSESTHAQIGSTFGLAFRRSTGTMYASAYLKRLAGFGPGLSGTDGSGTIYAITPNAGGADNGTAFVDLDTGGDTTGSSLHSSFTCGSGNSCDANAFANVGKASLGDLEMSGDETKMWTVNLLNKHLIEIQFSGPTIVDRGAIPAPACTGGSSRPFGLGWNDGLLYIGGVCDAFTSGSASDLSAYVYTFNPATNTFGGSPVITVPLNYNRTCLNRNTYDGDLPFCDGPTNSITAPSALWHPWTDTKGTIIQEDVSYQGANSSVGTGSGDRTGGYAQPMLSDIVFDNTDMILGFRDRTGDMLGYEDPGPNSTNPASGTNPNLRTLPGGDILRANPNGTGGWTIEYNAASNPTGIFSASGGAGNNQGPGGGSSATRGEFYYEERGPSNTTNHHTEASLGGLLQLPGFNEVALTSYSPYNSSTIGSLQLYNSGANQGQRERAIQVVGNANNSGAAGSNFSKTNGLGDLEAVLLPAPIQLGNRVWSDTDGDGIQDPGESAIAGLTVRIFEGGNLVGTTTTDANGEWYFSSSTVGDWGTDGIPNTTDDLALSGLKPSTNGVTHNYEVRIEPGQGSNTSLLTGYTLTTLNAPQPANGNLSATTNDPVKDIADSDASLSGGNNVISYTTAGIGVNNHGLDFGFKPFFSVGNRIWIDNGAGGGVANNGTMDGTEAGVNGVAVSLYQDSNGDGVPDGPALQTTTSANGGYYNFTNMPAGKYLVGIDASNFTSGQPLQGYYSSTGVKANDKADKGMDRANPGSSTYGILSSTLTVGPTNNAPTGTAETDFTTGQTQGGTQNGTVDGRANLQVDFGFQNSTPTAQDIGEFSVNATASPGVVLQWNTLNELNVMGFDVLRSESKQGGYAAINDALIPALSLGQLNGNAYAYTDSSVTAGATYWYRIEFVRPDGSRDRTDAAKVSVPAAGCALAAPVSTVPANAASVKRGKVSFTWNAVPCAVSYKWQLRADSPDGQSVANKKDLTATETSIKKLDAGKTYFWRALACDAGGKCTAGEWWSFKVKKSR